MRSARFLIVLFVALTLASGSLAQYSTSRLVGPIGRKLHPAPDALGFHSGALVETQDFDCLIFDPNGSYFNVGFIVGAFASYYGDPNSNPPTPKVGDIYYTDIYISNPAACQSAGVQPWLLLPANTSLAISGTNPVHCFKNGVAVTAGCSQSLQLGYSLSGAFGYNLGFWPNLNGGNIEIQVPVSTSSPGAVTLYFRVDTADGWSNPFITPSVSYIVGASATSPYIVYPANAISVITNTTATTTVDVFNQNLAGTMYIDIGTTTNYESASTGGNAIPSAGGPGWEVHADWVGLAPGTLYHWRGRFVYGTGGATALGADQTFTTSGTASVPGIPQGMTATPSSPTQVTVTWSTVVGATSYEVWRRGPSGMVLSYTMAGTVTSGTSFTDTVQANSAYLYKVRAVNAAGSSFFSPIDLATTVIYSDDRLVEFSTVIKLAHLTQLRTAVNAVRTLANLSPAVYPYTDPAPTAGVTKVKAIHIMELRTQYDAAMAVLTGVNSSWATSPVIGGPITFEEFQQLRDRLK